MNQSPTQRKIVPESVPPFRFQKAKSGPLHHGTTILERLFESHSLINNIAKDPTPVPQLRGSKMRVLLLLAIGIVWVPLDGRMHGFASYFNSKKIRVEVTELSVNKTPSWLGGSENPPLSARQAMQKAGKFKDTIVADTKDEKWVLKSAALCPFHGEKWYWLIHFEAEPLGAGIGGHPSHLKLAVLMDGTVVTPEFTNFGEDAK